MALDGTRTVPSSLFSQKKIQAYALLLAKSQQVPAGIYLQLRTCRNCPFAEWRSGSDSRDWQIYLNIPQQTIAVNTSTMPNVRSRERLDSSRACSQAKRGTPCDLSMLDDMFVPLPCADPNRQNRHLLQLPAEIGGQILGRTGAGCSSCQMHIPPPKAKTIQNMSTRRITRTSAVTSNNEPSCASHRGTTGKMATQNSAGQVTVRCGSRFPYAPQVPGNFLGKISPQMIRTGKTRDKPRASRRSAKTAEIRKYEG
jgi:hypothetical protein